MEIKSIYSVLNLKNPNDMITFEIGLTYTVLRKDGNEITFKFVGDNPPMGEVDGEELPLTEIMGVYTDCWLNE